MDGMRSAHKQCGDLGRSQSGIGSHKANSGNQSGCHRLLAVGFQGLGVGAQQVFLLSREGPTAAGERVIAVSGFKVVTRETGFHLLFQRNQQFIHRKYGIILLVAGMGCRDLFLPNQQKSFIVVHGQAGIEHTGQLLTAEFGQCGAADLCTIQQRLVGCRAQRIENTIHLQCEAEVFDGIRDRVQGGSRCECSRVTAQGRGSIQRLHM